MDEQNDMNGCIWCIFETHRCSVGTIGNVHLKVASGEILRNGHNAKTEANIFAKEKAAIFNLSAAGSVKERGHRWLVDLDEKPWSRPT